MNLRQYLGYPQKRLAFEVAIGAVVSKSAAPFLRKRSSPGLPELADLSRYLHGDLETLLEATPWSTGSLVGEQFSTWAGEHEELRAELDRRYETRQLAFPINWAVETGTSLLLYAVARALRPSVVVEMGVGNGQSSFYLLRALQANGTGTLYSFDIAAEAGGLLSEKEVEGWDFRLIDRRRPAKSLTRQLGQLPEADLCFHDADHGYLAQYFEFAQLWNQLTDTGVLVCDDVDLSYALIDFCELDGKRPDILIDGRKAIGILRRDVKAESALA